MRVMVFAALVAFGALLLFLAIAVLHPMLALLLCVFYSVLSAFGYVVFKEKNEKRGKKRGRKGEDEKIFGIRKDLLLAVVSFTGVAIGLFLAFGVFTGETTGGKCPEKMLGNASAPLIVKYFYSPFCSHCVENEQVKEEFAARHAGSVRFEQYDVRNCGGEAEKYGVYATPCYVFMKGGKNFTECGAMPLAELDSLLKRVG